MYGCENWIIKKAEHQRIDAFQLWCWRRIWRVPWTTRKSTLNIHWKDWWWSWNSSSLDYECEELTHWKRPWCWERLRTGGKENSRGWDGWIVSLTQWTWVWANSRRWWKTQKVVYGVTKSQTWLGDWTTTPWLAYGHHLPMSSHILLSVFVCVIISSYKNTSPIGLMSTLMTLL